MLEGIENRIVFIGMDQERDELLYSNVKGKNPFKDKRVRQALYQAIDIEAIKTTTMRGLSQPSGALLPSPVQSTPELEKRLPFDKAKAKKLLADAGYPNGFEVTLDCPNNRYVNDEKICQALAAMWAQIGVTIKVNAMPRANYFPEAREDRHQPVHAGLGRRRRPTRSSSCSRCCRPTTARATATTTTAATPIPKLDELIAKVKVDMNPDAAPARDPRGAAAHNAEINHLPLHRQVIPWATRSNVTAVHRADNNVMPYWVTIE